jgi:hypothetical protein
VVWETTDEHRHKDVRRHGSPIVLFDPTDSSSSATTTRRTGARAIEESVAQVRASDRSASGW